MFNAIKLLRIPFSIFLMPIFWFSLINLEGFSIVNAAYIFIILHLFVYPASNGYNSYFDKDEGSIGGLKNPPKVDKNLIRLVFFWDFLSVLFALFISIQFSILMAIYLIVSKLYSYKKTRLKKYPIVSTLVVTVFQGSFIYFSIQMSLSSSILLLKEPTNLIMGVTASLFLLGSYPITQIYQHDEDKKRGDTTLSILLGKKGTLIFAAVNFLLSTTLLAFCFYSQEELYKLFIYLLCGSPILLFFGNWVKKSFKNDAHFDYENTMKMNTISSLALSTAFILMILI